MAQSALTVTPENPSPPTNIASTGAMPPNPPNYTRQTYAGAFANPVTNPPPFYDDGTAGAMSTFAANVAALASGTSAADNNTGTTPGTAVLGAGGDGFNSVAGTFPVQGGLVPASASVAHEGAGTETLFTQTYSAAILAPIALTTVGCGPNASAASILAGPNANHASSLSPATNPTLTTIAPTTSVHGTGQITMTATGVGFTRQSKIALAGVPQTTTFVSSTSLTCLATPPASAGSVPVTVVTGGVVVTAPQTWTIS